MSIRSLLDTQTDRLQRVVRIGADIAMPLERVDRGDARVRMPIGAFSDIADSNNHRILTALEVERSLEDSEKKLLRRLWSMLPPTPQVKILQKAHSILEDAIGIGGQLAMEPSSAKSCIDIVRTMVALVDQMDKNLSRKTAMVESPLDFAQSTIPVMESMVLTLSAMRPNVPPFASPLRANAAGHAGVSSELSDLKKEAVHLLVFPTIDFSGHNFQARVALHSAVRMEREILVRWRSLLKAVANDDRWLSEGWDERLDNFNGKLIAGINRLQEFMLSASGDMRLNLNKLEEKINQHATSRSTLLWDLTTMEIYSGV